MTTKEEVYEVTIRPQDFRPYKGHARARLDKNGLVMIYMEDDMLRVLGLDEFTSKRIKKIKRDTKVPVVGVCVSDLGVDGRHDPYLSGARIDILVEFAPLEQVKHFKQNRGIGWHPLRLHHADSRLYACFHGSNVLLEEFLFDANGHQYIHIGYEVLGQRITLFMDDRE